MIDHPEALSPDTADWTWVLDSPCPECGYVAAGVQVRDVGDMIRNNSREWVSLLAAPPDIVSVRRRPQRWSTLEYACHVRDVLRIYNVRLGLMLDQDGPKYENWDQDASAVADRYFEQDPATVAIELADAADELAERFDRVRNDQLSRTGHRSDGATFTVESFARYFIHDPIHHLWDVR